MCILSGNNILNVLFFIGLPVKIKTGATITLSFIFKETVAKDSIQITCRNECILF